ncbi:hypothetical protein [Nocardia brasiliensis]|uniref:hypothetical protein n=1 Tax=Nocardia brasiliensis TaxID=37326 RepID=UPI00245389EB|nr:hypothetical protein [Nocardia brasiliensis]
MNTSAQHTDLSDLPPDLADALRYGAVAVIIGHNPDQPDTMRVEAFRLVPPISLPRRIIAAADTAHALRWMADSLESDGRPL